MTAKDILRENLLTLLRRDAGGELPAGTNGISALAKKAGKLGSWAQRLMDDTDVRLTSVEEAAAAFGLEPWQLLVPGFAAESPPALADDPGGWPFEMVDESAYRSLTPQDRAFVQAKADAAIEQRLAARTGNRRAA